MRRKKNKFANYEKWLANKDLATNTILSYLQAIKLYGNNPLTTEKLRDYVKNNLAKYEPSSLYTKIKALTVYCHYKKIKVNWERVLKLIPHYQPKLFPTLDISELARLKQARWEIDEALYQRNNLMLDFLFYTGVRVSELIHIKLTDYANKTLKITGKGNKVRFILLPDFLIAKLTNPYSHIYLFTNKHGQTLTRVFINQIIQVRVKLAKLNKNITPHSFRRSFATNLYKRNGRLETIQKQLGHSSLDTTMRYIHNDYDSLYNDYSKLWKEEKFLTSASSQ